MERKPFLLILAVLIGVVIYAYYAPKESPERATTLTPKQYIELVEQKKQERKAQAEKEAKPSEAETPQK
ncbi:aldehyde dehydrogenase [Sedimenticola sp.]|uniref:aldehyde dehydrogenase n=1 Tax=Sedimenticola sp. TaxID=1940285 RepID=UPI003D13B1C6